MASFQPQQFGRYYLVDRIAVGGMAEVFKARAFSDGGFQKLLVIKRILQHLSGNEEFVDMFIDEAKISVELQHPNIVQIYDFGRIGEEYFLAMECIEGKDVKGILRKLAKRRQVMPPEFGAFIAVEMCKGLDFAHKKADLHGEPLGIIHRDISPSNILVSYNAEVKVADFGIAKAENSLYNTKDGVLKGKFEYMSPEQASGDTVTPLSDVFSVGILLHEMLTGRRLFKTDSDVKTLNKVKAVDIPRPRALNPGVPIRLDEIVMRALSRDPQERYDDARGLQQALLEYLYPTTPLVVQEDLKRLLQELFADEIRTERGRLQEGSATALQMFNEEPGLELDPGWEEPASSARTLATSESRSPSSAVLAGALVGLLALVGVGAFLFLGGDSAPVESAGGPEAQAPALASLQLRIDPEEVEVALEVAGKKVAVGSTSLMATGLEPGADVPIRVVAEGYEPHNDTVDLVGNERLRIPVQLTPLAQPQAPAPPVRPPAGTGADGSVAPAPAATPAPAPPEAAPASAPPPAPAPAPVKGPGTINVNVRGGWATVYIDGTEIDSTPLVKHPLPAGTHSVRVVNPTTGLDETKSITVGPGELTKVVF